MKNIYEKIDRFIFSNYMKERIDLLSFKSYDNICFNVRKTVRDIVFPIRDIFVYYNQENK